MNQQLAKDRRVASAGAELQKCRVDYKGKERDAHILEEKADKVKVCIDEEPHKGKTDWYERKQIKRVWS